MLVWIFFPSIIIITRHLWKNDLEIIEDIR